MTNTEVEDVLASIRRLVSDEKRPDTDPAEAASADRLVLTPSLRVMDDPTPEPDEEHRAEEGVRVPEADQRNDDADDAAGEIEENAFDHADVDEDRADTSSEPTDEPEEEARTYAQEEAFADEAAQEAPFVFVEADAASEDKPEHAWDDAEAEASDTLNETEQNADHDTNSVDGTAEEQYDTHHTEAAPDDAAHVEEDADHEEPQDAGEPEMDHPEDAVSETQTLGEKIAALETLIGGRDEEFEPDDPGTDDYAGTEAPAMAWEDAGDVQADETPAYAAFVNTRTAPEDDVEPAQIFSTDEDVLDEEALRELVSDIVREELQGALGERITRNVRKLVRREIHRALAAQELE